MLNLLKANLYRLMKDKLVIIVLILIGGFAILTTALLFGLNKIMGGVSGMEGLATTVDGRTMFLNSLSLSNNMGIAFPIFIALYLCKDYQYGTIRNQIISGNHRESIYIANWLTAILMGIAMLLINTFFNFIIGLIFGGYGTSFTSNEVGFLFASLGLVILIMITIATFTHLLSALFKNLALTIIISLVTLMFLSMISTLTMFIEFLPNWLIFIFKMIPTMQDTLIIGGVMASSDGVKIALMTIISNICYIAILFGLGILKYRHTEFK